MFRTGRTVRTERTGKGVELNVVLQNTCLFSKGTILLFLSVAGFVVSLLSAASATWLAAAVIRSHGGSVTVSCCSCPFPASSHHQAADNLSAQLLLSAEPSCNTSVAPGSAVKLCVGASAGSELGTSQKYGSGDHAAPANALQTLF